VGFELAAVPQRIVRATLSVYALSGSRTGYAVAVAPGVTWRGQRLHPSGPAPAVASATASSAGFAPHTWTSVDVTELVRGHRGVTLALLPLGRSEIAFSSSEATATAPRLIVEAARGHAAAPAFAGAVATRRDAAPLVAAAGDIACDPANPDFVATRGTGTDCAMRATSALVLRARPDVVLTLGDNQYDDSAYDKYRLSFAPTWGRLLPTMHPAIGNHEYATPEAAGYFRYFGRRAGAAGRGWYSLDIGRWHVVALNSECGHVGGCGPGSPQEAWLRRDLAAHPAACTLAYWHEPRFSSGQHGDAQQMATIWNDLATARADIVLSGHNHDYERFDGLGATPAATGADGGTPSYQAPAPDPAGIREFVVGTGGEQLHHFRHAPLAGEAVRSDDTYGVLLLRLRAASYSWRFAPAGGTSGTFTDAGSGTCR